MIYSEYVTALGDTLQWAITDATSATPFVNNDYNNILPRIIEYAELRMYREFDFISTTISNTGTLTANNRNLALPSTLVVLQSANVVTPASTAPDSGTRVPLRRVSIEFLNYTYPTSTVSANNGVPEYFSEFQTTLTTNPMASNVVFGPAPDATYVVEFLGTQRPAALSSSNTSTFLTLNMPDMFTIASYIYGSGFQGNYSSQASDPQQIPAWEGQYQTLKAGLQVEELRKKAQSTQWQAYLPSPLAAREQAAPLLPPRG